MTHRVELKPAAKRDLDRLAEFLATLDPRAADRRELWLREQMRRLEKHPYLGRLGPKPDLRELVLRFGKSSYLVRYQITADTILITRIWHGRENRPR